MSDQPTADFADTYRTALEQYVETGEEHQLEEAFALGRRAFAGGVTLLSLLDVHRTSVEDLVRRAPIGMADAATGRVTATFQMLAEALATFEMAQRGYWEAQERARWEHQQSTLREQLAQAYMTVDRAPLDGPERLAVIERTAGDLVGVDGACRVVSIGDAGQAGPDDDGDRADDAARPRDEVIFPIRNPRGQPMALLTVDLSDRGRLSDDQRYLLTEFALMAGVALENSRQFAREQQIASMLQRDLLPAALPTVPGLDIALRYLPGEPNSHAGGDWYDVFEIDDGRVGLVVGDITGHGVAAAAAMGQLRIAVLAYALAGYEPAQVVEQVDRLIERMGSGTIATMVYVLVDPARTELTVVNAGHPPPLAVTADGASQELYAGHARLLGISPPLEGRQQQLVTLTAGSHVLLYTDGLLEPLERSGHDGIARLQQATEGFTGTAEDLCDRVLDVLAPDGADDDTCILAVTLAPPAAG
jgi:serine phosphatase RsbU (regulator of sigma subunit)